MYIFISHSSANAQVAEGICSKIEASGHKCFIAPRDIRQGYEYAAEIMNGIDSADAMILVLTKNAVDSPHVLREIERAVSKRVPIIVYKIEESELSKSMEYFLMTHQWITNPKPGYEDIIDAITTLGKDNPAVSYSNARKKKMSRYYILPIAIVISAVLIAGTIMAGTFILKDDEEDVDTSHVQVEGSVDENESSDGSSQNQGESTDAPSQNQNESPNDGETPDNSDEEGDAQNSIQYAVEADFTLGGNVVFGNYNEAPIKWRVIKLNDDNTAVLISEKILTMKAFTAAASGKGGYYEGKDQYGQDAPAKTDLEIQKIAWGDSTWANSTLRTWLNSDKKIVKYSGQAPVEEAFTDMNNGYSKEPGFLYGFTKGEKAAIVETTISTKGNDIAEEEIIKTEDKVYLLSSKELEWIEAAKVPLYAIPTPEAVEKDEDTVYKEICQSVYKTNSHFWWLRDPVEGFSAKCYTVSIEPTGIVLNDQYYAIVPSIGVRPVITVDMDKVKELL